MSANEIRHRLITTLLQAEEPMAGGDLLAQAEAPLAEAAPVLARLVGDGLVVEGDLVPGVPGPHYRWAARWQEDLRRRAVDDREKLRGEVVAAGAAGSRGLDLEDEPVVAFNEWLLKEYRPPKDKRLLVILQCSVRRPFSSSPSHASMRRAIWVATGFDPRQDQERCPVHVVVLASALGPVPYELEGVYPANVGGGGVKHFEETHYARARPILAERMARYVVTHRGSYDRIATFTEGRYAAVMADAGGRIVARAPDAPPVRILPVPGGPEVLRMGRSAPRMYWERFWIQLALEVAGWLSPAEQAQASARLGELGVHLRGTHA